MTLVSNGKFFTEDTSLFSMNENLSAKYLKNDLVKISYWRFQWKMNFNPDPAKQTQELIFSRKTKKQNHLPLSFNRSFVIETASQNHLGMVLDS